MQTAQQQVEKKMILLTVAFLFIVGGVVLFIGILALSKISYADFLKEGSEFLIKSSVACFGIAIGLLVFFLQKEVEETNERIKQAREAFGEIMIMGDEYQKSDAELAYWNNETYFDRLRKSCDAAGNKCNSEDSDGSCNDFVYVKPLETGTLLFASRYFNYEMNRDFYPLFPQRLYEQQYVVTQEGGMARRMLDEYNNIKHNYYMLRAGVDDLKVDFVDFDKKFKLSLKLSHRRYSEDIMASYTIKVCSSVFYIAFYSDQIRKYADAQARNLCEVKLGIKEDVKSSVHTLYSYVIQDKYKKMLHYMDENSTAESCSFVPAPLAPWR